MTRELKDSGVKWAGKIPKHWEVHPVRNYFAERIHKNSFGEESNLLSLSYGKIVRKDINAVGGLLPASYNTYNIIEAGDIVVRPTDLQNDKKSLRTGLSREHGIVTSAYIALKPIDGTFSPYYHYLLHCYDTLKVFYNMGNGVRQGLNYSEFSKLLLLVPPLSEQQAIADFLDGKCAEIDRLLADLEAEAKTLAEYKKSIIAETVTRGQNSNVPMKQSGIPWAEMIPAHWTTKKFRYKLKVRRVFGQGDKQVLSVYREYGVIPKDSRDDNHNVTSEDTSKYKYVRPNDFVINKMKAWQGSMGVSEHEGIVSPAYFVYEFSDKDYNPRYFHYYMRNAYNIPEYRRLSGGIREGQWDLSPYDLGNMPIIVPPKAEQDKIVAYLDKKCAIIDQSIADKQTQIETLKSYKSSLIYEYVTGKKQVI